VLGWPAAVLFRVVKGAGLNGTVGVPIPLLPKGTVGTLPVPAGVTLPVVMFGRGYSGEMVPEGGGTVVGPVPDAGSVSLKPDGVPVGPTTALEFVDGYGAILDNTELGD
jgi:hypothetical protein